MTDYNLTYEYRRLPRFNKNVIVSETLDNTFAYSKVELNKNASKIVVSIGMNPRFRANIEKITRDKALTFKPGTLEKTRLNTIYNLHHLLNLNNINSLIQLDLFSKRTNTGIELNKEIMASKNVINDIVGNNNLDILKKYIRNADYIVLAWGGTPYINWNEIKEFQTFMYLETSKILEKILIFGLNKNGTPMHSTSNNSPKKEFRFATLDELKKIFQIEK